MLPEVFDILREVSSHPRPTSTGPVRLSPTQKRIIAILTAAFVPLTIAVVALGYFIGGRGTLLFALSEVGMMALMTVIGFMIIKALKFPIDFDEQIGHIDWLAHVNALDDAARMRHIAAKWLHQAAVLTMLGLVPVLSAITCTAAIIQTTRVLEIASRLNLPRSFRRLAQSLRITAVIILVLYGSIAAFLPIFSLRPAYPPPLILHP